MQPTKYPLQAPSVPAVGFADAMCSSMVHGGDCDPVTTVRGTSAAAWGREAPLDLIEEHLTSTTHETLYRRAAHGGVLVKNWFVPDDWNGTGGAPKYVLKVQPLGAAGYEASLRQVDMDRIGDAILNGGLRGKREAPEVISYDNLQKAACRAKRQMRLLTKNMMADHLVTFTKREAEGSVYSTPEQWAHDWDRFRRLLTKVIGEFPYVAILEKHAKGNYHLHVAWCGRVAVGLVRKIWLAVVGGGKGCGNIDAKHIKVPSGADRASRIARYISKYVSKHFEDSPRFNKKRYWASRQTLEEARRYVLTADTLDGAVEQMRKMLGLDFSKFVVMVGGKLKTEGLFSFPDGSGLWLSYNPDLHAVDPPF